ncbi:transposase family protein [Acidisoma cellulosilytica]|uniref:Transposase family protein n=1 Tax=Acidisoma cellulosilyticum TaxID=2802395 RepID=A0A963Z6I6_9PROT|nr:transposase family protein [Acidisoma cellulosilyticum]
MLCRHPLEIPSCLLLCQVASKSDGVWIDVEPRARSARCPACGDHSRQIHSRYHRKLSDRPWQGQRTILVVLAPRLRCSQSACGRRTFIEPLDEVVPRRGRYTNRLADLSGRPRSVRRRGTRWLYIRRESCRSQIEK